MDELTQSLDAFGPWDWACVGANLTAAALGIFAIRCWRGMPGVLPPLPVSASNAALGVVTGVMSFGLILGLIYAAVAQAFSTHFGISQAHEFTAQFIGQSAAALSMVAMGALVPETLRWAPDVAADESSDGPLRRSVRAFTFPRLLLALLILFAVGLALTALWKGVHVGWTQLFQDGLLGEPPADEPQGVVDSVLKTDVDSWRFGTIVLAVTIGAPIMEELAFRGMLYPGLRRILSDSNQWCRGILWLAIVLPITAWLCSGSNLDVFAIPDLDPKSLMPADGSTGKRREVLILINFVIKSAALLLISSSFAVAMVKLASERHARWIAVALTGAIFSAVHGSASAALPLFGFGAFMCLVRDRYGLLTCMAAHACFNGWNLVWLKLAPAASTL
jgi:membrane protease YdiL (CAAX protease family)